MSRAVVTAAVESLLVAPREGASVETQAVLGTTLRLLGESSNEFLKARTPDGSEGWIAAAQLVPRGDDEPDYADPLRAETVVVTSRVAHLYAEPSFSGAPPLLTVPMGTRLERAPSRETDPSFLAVTLPSARQAFLADGDTYPRGAPTTLLQLATEMLGVPYTWGGTTPLGFDCSGLVQFLFWQRGVLLPRNAHDQCFREPRLVAVAFESLREEDLVFCGTPERVDHVAIWAGGTFESAGVLFEATRAGRPSTKMSSFEARHLKPRALHARRFTGKSSA